MQARELPQMTATTLASNTANWVGTSAVGLGFGDPNLNQWQNLMAQAALQQNDFVIAQPPIAQPKTQPKAKEIKMAEPTAPARRLVQVFIADPDQNVPLDKALLYSGEQQMTDLSDQELFFEIDISGVLKRHNEARVKFTDKSVKSKTVHLEPARIRDLRMTVVTIAAF